MEGKDLVGIVSERDYERKVILQRKASRETQVREIMSHPVISARYQLTFEEKMTLMAEKRIRHLPVMADGRVVGVVLIGDVVRGIIKDNKLEIEQLTNYITN